MTDRKTQLVNKNFFCDGSFYLITSSSLGNSHYKPDEISEKMLQSEEGIIKLLEEGIALPLLFPGDCALDNCTRFVLGELTESEEKNWVGKITSKLKVPCGRVILLAGGGDPDELGKALSGKEPDKHYVFYDKFEIPPGNYLIEIYCYKDSMSFQVDFDPDFLSGKEKEDLLAKRKYYQENFQSIGDEHYIIRFSELNDNPEIPELSEELWCGTYKYRV